jgi:TolA-binding protein
MLRLSTLRALLLSLLCFGLATAVAAQAPVTAVRPAVGTSAAGAGNGQPPPLAASELDEVRRQLREQRDELERMRSTITQQSQVIDELRQRVEQTAERQNALTNSIKRGEIAATDALPVDASSDPSNSAVAARQAKADERLKSVEEQTKRTSDAVAKQLGSITFSGDLRLRYESLYGQLNALPNGDNPAILGNDLSTRQRFRIRARLNIRGQLGKEFDWGLRLGSGSYADAISNNQTLTDFYNRKPFSLDNAYVAWKPRQAQAKACKQGDERGLRLQGGKFDVPWTRTELTIDNDLNPEGFSELYSRDFNCAQKSGFRNLTVVAWQLPFLERNSGFVRNANGTVNIDESRRAGRDLALYGAQLQASFRPSLNTELTLSAADLYFNGTQFISPIQVFGANLQLPVTFLIPATATTPAQTVTAQVSIPRELLVSGNGNLGLSIASNNATNRDGRLSSGYNLVDLIGKLELLKNSKRFPMTLIFDFVTNTQTHDVAVAGAGGTTLFLPNHENNGYWAEIQVGKAVDSKERVRGEMTFGYTLARIEKDAVLTPFNASDIGQQSDVRVHRFSFDYLAYGEAKRQYNRTVRLTLTGFITERPNGLLGVFGATPQGSLNTPSTRLQFDTTFRF